MALPNVPTVGYQNFHLVIVGDRGTGKTSFVKTCLTREFVKNEESTKGIKFHLLDFSTNVGKLRINCWEVEEKTEFRALRNRCYKQCDFAIIMYDVTKRSSYNNVFDWHNELYSVNKNIKIVICGNKADDKKRREIKPHMATFPRLNSPEHYETSAKSHSNLEQPFLYFARRFLSNPTLQFEEARAPDECLSLKFPELQCTRSGWTMDRADMRADAAPKNYDGSAYHC
ncbi:GTP-binding nuclear protein Ran-3 [Tanacetum coccineum]